MHLSKKLKTSCGFFIAFLASTLIFEYFETKLNLISKVFLKLLTPK